MKTDENMLHPISGKKQDFFFLTENEPCFLDHLYLFNLYYDISFMTIKHIAQFNISSSLRILTNE